MQRFLAFIPWTFRTWYFAGENSRRAQFSYSRGIHHGCNEPYHVAQHKKYTGQLAHGRNKPRRFASTQANDFGSIMIERMW